MRLIHNERGQIDPLIVPLVISVVMILGLAGFGLWSYISFVDERDNTQEKIDVAVQEAEAAITTELEADFTEREKEPYLNYVASNTVGSLSVTYPKTWSGFVSESSGTTPLDAFFHPGFVPDSNDVQYALRVSVEEKDYNREVSELQKDVESGELTVTTITVSGEQGLRFDGEIENDTFGAIVLLPLRDKTIKVWTESQVYVDDLTNIVLENLSYEP